MHADTVIRATSTPQESEESGMDFDGEVSSIPGDGFVAVNVEGLIVDAADRWEPSSASPRSLVTLLMISSSSFPFQHHGLEDGCIVELD
ncbi:hypothetical protein BHM03_00027307 [Ensete ventricosum]|nr:hypothetical protein BHM03_00027307 [Ensete ventricosum]